MTVSVKIAGKGKNASKGAHKGKNLSAKAPSAPTLSAAAQDIIGAALLADANGTPELAGAILDAAHNGGDIASVLDAGNVDNGDGTQSIAEIAETDKGDDAAPAMTAKDVLTEWLRPTTLVTVTLPNGSRETSRWLVCPEGKNGHRASFDKTKIAGFTSLTAITTPAVDDTWEYGGAKGNGATVTAPRAAFLYRRMGHLIPAAPPAIEAAIEAPADDTPQAE